MTTDFPTSLDSYTRPTSGQTLAAAGHAAVHDDAFDAIEALETKIGVDGSAVTASLDYKLANLALADISDAGTAAAAATGDFDAAGAAASAQAAAEATAANADNLTSGTVADARIASTIARDSEVSGAISTHAGATDPHGDRAYADGLASNYDAAGVAAALVDDLSGVSDASTARTNLGLGTAAVADLIDEDDMVSDSAAALPTQQSVKAYVDANVVSDVIPASLATQAASLLVSDGVASWDELPIGADGTVLGATSGAVGFKSPWAFPLGANAQTGTTYSYQASDVGKVVTHANASDVVGTLPASTFAAGEMFYVAQTGDGVLSVDASAVTVIPADNTLIARQKGSMIGFLCLGSDVFLAFGDTVAPSPTQTTVSGTTHTLAEEDFYTTLRCTNAAGCEITVPASLAINAGDRVDAVGTQGQVTFTESSTTINVAATFVAVTAEAFAPASLVCVGTDEFDLYGNLEAA